MLVIEQFSCNEVNTMVSFCSEDKVVTSRSETVVVTVELWKELLQDMMLIVLDSVAVSYTHLTLPTIYSV